MNRCYKMIKDGMIVAVGQDALTGEEITEAEYNSLKAIIDNKPADTETHYYVLKADTLEYEAVERPEPITMDSDPEQAVVDSIMQEVSSYGY
ncbi:MAG: hypothetical protein PUK54_06930 [Firmicutes bacterium]|nr:hypothetical protein [Bacillota bacterium]MDY5855606.1 hypothetical protein [Anaerovoracaceae bacterium]